MGEEAEETQKVGLCPFGDGDDVEDRRFFSGNGGWMAGIVMAVYPVYGT